MGVPCRTGKRGTFLLWCGLTRNDGGAVPPAPHCHRFLLEEA